MPRQARSMSPSGHFHIITRGIGKQVLFEEPDDYHFYLNKLHEYCSECDVSIYAYCLMTNHVHLLVCDHEGSLSTLMKKLGVSYAGYFNKKYCRSGHLFQDRYFSTPITSEQQLLAALRYILNNPKKAGICEADSYPWSSYELYDSQSSFVDASILRDMLGERKEYEAFVRAGEADSGMEFEPFRKDDEWAKSVIRDLLNVESGTVLQTMSISERNACIRALKSHGLSVRQIERLTGIGRSIVSRA